MSLSGLQNPASDPDGLLPNHESKDMTTKSSSPKPKPPPTQRWRIVIGEREQIVTSEALARKVWSSLRRSADGENAKLINPDGENEAP